MGLLVCERHLKCVVGDGAQSLVINSGECVASAGVPKKIVVSEYQYYEFVAIDQPLTPTQLAELRSRSSRATITPTSFVNDYQWGNLKGDPADWMRRYFDAHVYVANWNSCRLLLRVPRVAFDTETLQAFETESALTVDRSNSLKLIRTC